MYHLFEMASIVIGSIDSLFRKFCDHHVFKISSNNSKLIAMTVVQLLA